MSNDKPLANTASGLIQVEQARAKALVQAQIEVAVARPRDINHVIEEVDTVFSLAEVVEEALYAYPRGNEIVEGFTIRAAETMAGLFGHISYGTRELSREGGESLVQTYAYDCQKNVQAIREFRVRHVRKRGATEVRLKDERDIAEAVQSRASRGVRACILEIMPVFLKQRARRKVDEVNAQAVTPEAIEKLKAAFKEQKISEERLVKFIGRPLASITAPEMSRLRAAYRSLVDGMAAADELFPEDTAADVQEEIAKGMKQARTGQAGDAPPEEKAKDPKPQGGDK